MECRREELLDTADFVATRRGEAQAARNPGSPCVNFAGGCSADQAGSPERFGRANHDYRERSLAEMAVSGANRHGRCLDVEQKHHRRHLSNEKDG